MAQPRPPHALRATAERVPSRIELSIDSRLEQARLVAAAVRGIAADLHLDRAEAYRIETAVVEALNNAILHAYGNRPGQRVGIAIDVADDALTIEVSDSGPPLPQLASGTTSVSPAAQPDLSEHGRGWAIMRAWMDDVCYVRRGALNVVRLRKQLAKRP